MSNTTKTQCCYCYSRLSDDSRCCGVCYYTCPSKSKVEQCNVCDNNVYDFCSSGYIQTTSGTGNKEKDGCDEIGWNDCCCTMICLPIKFPLFLPCCIGSMINDCINNLAFTYKNYLF